MKNKLLIAAVVVVGLASVAYAAFSQILTINGTGSASGSWSVKITGITKTSSAGATETTVPSFTDTSATFNVDLAYPGAYATYQVAIANSGTINGLLSSIEGLTEANAAAPSHIIYTLTGVEPLTTTIAANGGTNTATVKVEWDAASAPTTPSGSKTATIQLNYAQETP